MALIAAKNEYELVFQPLAGGGLAFECYHLPSTVPMSSLHFQPGDKINISVQKADDKSLAVKSLELDFQVKGHGALSPLEEGNKAKFIWHPGTKCPYIGKACGIWGFKPTLKLKDDALYVLRDDVMLLPEFQVGDGGGVPSSHSAGKA